MSLNISLYLLRYFTVDSAPSTFWGYALQLSRTVQLRVLLHITVWRFAQVVTSYLKGVYVTTPRSEIKSQRPIRNPGPFTPKSDQFQTSPAASPEILHHTAWRTWLFIAYSDERWLIYQFSLPHLYTSIFFKGWGNVLFERGSERVQEWLISSFPCSLTRKHYITQYEELGFSSLTQTHEGLYYQLSLHHLNISFKRLGERTLFNLGVKGLKTQWIWEVARYFVSQSWVHSHSWEYYGCETKIDRQIIQLEMTSKPSSTTNEQAA